MWTRQSINRLPDTFYMIFLVRFVPMTFVMGTIFFLSHQSGDNLNLPSFPGVDKLAHMLAYGVLAFSVLWYSGKKGLDKPRYTVALTVLFCLLYGISDEYHQSFIPFRSVSVLDVFADTAGAFCVSLIWMMSPILQQRMVAFQTKIVKYLYFNERTSL